MTEQGAFERGRLRERQEQDEVRVVNEATGGAKGQKLARYELIPVTPLREVAELYGRGAEKYKTRNWELGYDWSLSYAAAQRHLNQFWGGESRDGETGGHHLASVVFHCFAMMEYERTHPELDDRPNPTREDDAKISEPDEWTFRFSPDYVNTPQTPQEKEDDLTRWQVAFDEQIAHQHRMPFVSASRTPVEDTVRTAGNLDRTRLTWKDDGFLAYQLQDPWSPETVHDSWGDLGADITPTWDDLGKDEFLDEFSEHDTPVARDPAPDKGLPGGGDSVSVKLDRIAAIVDPLPPCPCVYCQPVPNPPWYGVTYDDYLRSHTVRSEPDPLATTIISTDEAKRQALQVLAKFHLDNPGDGNRHFNGPKQNEPEWTPGTSG